MAAKKKAKARPAAKKKRATRRRAAPKPEPGPFRDIAHPKQRAFLTAFVETASVVRAAAAAKVSREIHYHWKKDPAYADAFKAAEELAGDTLEAEAVRRAHEGIEEPIVHHGRIMGLWVLPDGRRLPGHTGEEPPEDGASFEPLTINKRSDALLRTLLEGFMGQKYATHRHQVSGAGGGAVPLGGYGVLLVPANPESMDEWQKQHGTPPTEETT